MKSDESFMNLSSALLSERGASERYQRAKTPHTIFTWWARRPFAAMRGVIWSALFAEMVAPDRLTRDPNLFEAELTRFPNLRSTRVLDPFSGGATIPLEIASLGAAAYAVDNNELAQFIEYALLCLSHTTQNLPDLISRRGKVLLDRLEEETAPLFPSRKNLVTGYFWSRSLQCPDCRSPLSLLRRPFLSRKRKQNLHIARRPLIDQRRFDCTIESDSELQQSNAWCKGGICCPFCNNVTPKNEVGRAMAEHGFDELLAFYSTMPRGKTFGVVRNKSEFCPNEIMLQEVIEDDLRTMSAELPEAQLPRWSGITNPTLYGLSRFSDLFSMRQLSVLVKCCRLIRDEYSYCVKEYGDEVARSVAAFLSAFIDQLADWNCRLCMWIAQNEQVGRGLSGPGIPMMWDFVETDPTGPGPANLRAKLKRIVAGLKGIPKFNTRPTVLAADSTHLPFPDGYFDLVATDPPYFDNIFYNVLADCIYVWKRLALSPIFPQFFTGASTNHTRELSASRHRHGSMTAATEFYTKGMTQVLRESNRVLKEAGSVALIYAHSSVDGWASILDSFQNAGLQLAACLELRIERKHRPRAMHSDAVNTCFLLVGRKQRPSIVAIEVSELLESIAARLRNERAQIHDLVPVDLGWVLFGVALTKLAKYASVVESGVPLSNQELVSRIAALISAEVPAFTLVRREKKPRQKVMSNR